MSIDVEASCSYCGNDDLLCKNCDDITDYIDRDDLPTPVSATAYVELHPRVRADIITSKPACPCDGLNGKWDMCDYHRGMQDGLDL